MDNNYKLTLLTKSAGPELEHATFKDTVIPDCVVTDSLLRIKCDLDEIKEVLKWID